MSKPVIHLYTLCYNEEVILPYFLRHYLSFVERVTIFDNFSTDNSREIALSFGEKVRIRQFDSNNEFNDQVHMDIKNSCWKASRGEADFVIVCDADEFVHHPDLNVFFSNLRESGNTLVTPVGYDMVSEKLPTAEAQIYDQIDQGVRADYLDKTVIFDPNRIEEMSYGPGSHLCAPKGVVKWAANDGRLKLLHFRYFGLDNLLRKYRVYADRLSRVNRESGWGYHYGLSHDEQLALWDRLLRDKKPVFGD